MKIRILSLLVVFSMVFALGMIPVSAAALANKDYTEDIKFLNAVGISDISPERTDEAVTRRDAVLMALGLHAKNSVLLAYNNEFSDVSADDAEAGKLLYAVKNGLIAKTSDNRFLPGGKLKYIDALKLVFHSINYGYMAKSMGKGDSVYYSFASRYDVKVKAVNNEALTVGEFAHLVALAADAPLVMVSSVNHDGDIYYSIHKGVTALTQYYNISKINGTVTKNNFTSLYESDAHLSPAITVDDMVLKCSASVDTQSLLARSITAYYEKESKTLVYHKFDNKDNVITLECEDILKFENSTYYYTQGTKEKKQTIQRNAAIIYNGVAVTSADYNDFMIKSGHIPQNGHVELIENVSGNCDCIKITNYETYVVQSVDVSGLKIVDKYGGTPLNFETTENLFVCDINGEPIGFDYIDGMNILSVAASLNGYAAKVIVTADAVEGTLVSRYNNEIQLEGETFTMSKALLDKIENNIVKMPTLSEEVVIYFDARGRVAACEPSSNTGWEYGFLIEKGLERGMDAKLMIKMLTKSGDIGIYDLATNIKIDGKKYKKNIQGAYDDITNEKLNVPVKYRLNANGEIKDLDTPTQGASEDENSIKHVLDSEQIKWIDYVSAFSGNIYMKAGAVCFEIPANPTGDARDYSVSTVEASFVKDTNYNISVYGENPDDLVNTVVVKKSNVSRSVLPSDIISVVDKVSRGIDSQGNEVWKIYAVNSGSILAYTIEDNSIYDHNTDPDPLERGDVVRFRANSRCEVQAMERTFDNGTRTIPGAISGEYASDTSTPCLYPADGDLNVMFHLAYGKTLNFKNNIMQMRYNDDAGTIQNYYYMGRIIVVDKDKVRMGSLTDLVFDPTGSISSNILLEMRYMRVRSIVVYQN